MDRDRRGRRRARQARLQQLQRHVAVAGDEIRTSPLATTRMRCPEPGGGAQERAVVAVLSDPVRWRLADGQLMLVSADRTQELLFVSD
jgi:heat shock protein HslJ